MLALTKILALGAELADVTAAALATIDTDDVTEVTRARARVGALVVALSGLAAPLGAAHEALGAREVLLLAERFYP